MSDYYFALENILGYRWLSQFGTFGYLYIDNNQYWFDISSVDFVNLLLVIILSVLIFNIGKLLYKIFKKGVW